MDEAQAEAQFVEVGGSCAAIRSQATAVDVTGTMPMKLSGPADVGVDQDPAASGCAEPAPEAEVEADDVEEIDGTTHEHILEGEDMPGLRCVAGEVGSDDLDVERVLKEFAAKLKLLMSRRGSSGGQTFDQDMDSFRRLAESMSAAQLQDKLNKLVAQMDHAEGVQASVDGRKSVQVVHTGTVPLSMYSPEYWQKCFPEMFPYGDGVYGIVRDTPLTFREWAAYLFERAELEYEVAAAGEDSAGTGRDTDDHDENVKRRCVREETSRFQPPAIPRWAGELNFLSVACDTWKRMEMVRLASAHVKRKKFKQSLQAVLQCTSERLRAAVAALGENANLGDVMRSSVVDANIRDALSQLLFFSSEVVGTDGARQQLRHEQNGAMLMLLGILKGHKFWKKECSQFSVSAIRVIRERSCISVQNGAILMLLAILKGYKFWKKNGSQFFCCHKSHTRAFLYVNRR